MNQDIHNLRFTANGVAPVSWREISIILTQTTSSFTKHPHHQLVSSASACLVFAKICFDVLGIRDEKRSVLTILEIEWVPKG